MRKKPSGVIPHLGSIGPKDGRVEEKLLPIGVVGCILHDGNPFQLFSYLNAPDILSTFKLNTTKQTNANHKYPYQRKKKEKWQSKEKKRKGEKCI